MATSKRWFWIGSRPAVRDAVAAAMGGQPVASSVASATAGDVVVVDALASANDDPGLPAAHAFGGVRSLKDRAGVQVFVVVDANDRVGAQLARFCLADGVLAWHGENGQLDARELRGSPPGRPRPAVDELLARLEAQASARGESTLERLMRLPQEDSLLHRLQDAETGLFDGPYATLKLDEEWKRAHRFHQPLSLLLIDLGAAIAQLGDAERRLVFAEAAGVFLNECRDIDVLARFAPTVFLFLLPGTGPDGCEVLAKRILRALQQRFAARHDVRPVAGVCSVPSSEVPDCRSFLVVAEACLRRAGAAGPGAVGTSWQ